MLSLTACREEPYIACKGNPACKIRCAPDTALFLLCLGFVPLPGKEEELRRYLFFILLTVSSAVSNGSEMEVSLAGVPYLENFNGFLGTYETLPVGCFVSLDSSNLLTATNTDFHGIHAGGVTAGGCYAWNVGRNDYALGYQPTDSEFTPGFFLVVVSNATKVVVQELDVSYDVFCLNNADRSSSLDFEISCDGKFYSRLTGLVFVSGQLRDDSGSWVRSARSCHIVFPKPVAVGNCIWLRWLGNDAGGASSRDEYGIDNLRIILHHKGGTVISIR